MMGGLEGTETFYPWTRYLLLHVASFSIVPTIGNKILRNLEHLRSLRIWKLDFEKVRKRNQHLGTRWGSFHVVKSASRQIVPLR